MNNKHVGFLTKELTGAIEFSYDKLWLSWEHAIPISLSIPLREETFKGEEVAGSRLKCNFVTESKYKLFA